MNTVLAIFALVGWLVVFVSADALWGLPAALFAGGVGIVLGVLAGTIEAQLIKISKILEQANSSKTKDLQQ